MCEIKHWVLVLNVNAALSFASCCISHLNLVHYYQCSIDDSPLLLVKYVVLVFVCMYITSMMFLIINVCNNVSS